MKQFNTNLYKVKRSLIHYANRLTKGAGRVQQKFLADMFYGMHASGSCQLASIARPLKETTKIQNTVDRFSRLLNTPLDCQIHKQYLQTVIPMLDERPLILVDDTDIVKPAAKHFEYIDRVRDGSKSSDTKTVFGRGYWCTEFVGLSAQSKHPISLASEIFSSRQPLFESTNTVLDQALLALDRTFLETKQAATFVFDRGFDRNTLFGLFLEEFEQEHHFIARLKRNRNLLYQGRSWPIEELGARFKGQYKTKLIRWDRDKSRPKEELAYVTSTRVHLPAYAKHDIGLVLVYPEHGGRPMYLLTNAPVNTKEETLAVVFAYNSRWRIEEYFRCKKQSYGFEGFRVRSLQSIQNLNAILSYALSWLAILADQATNPEHYSSKVLVYAKPIRETVRFIYYRLADGVQVLFQGARQGVRAYFLPRARPDPQLTFEDYLAKRA